MEACGSWLQWASEKGSPLGNHSHRIGPLEMMKKYGRFSGSDYVSEGVLLSSAPLGLLTGILLILFIRHKLLILKDEYSKSKVSFFSNKSNVKDIQRSLFVLYAFLKFALISPIFIAMYLCFKMNRYFVGLVLKRRHGSHFKGLLDGADVVWAIESENSRGMINIMAYIEEPAEDHQQVREYSTSSELLLVLRKRISSRLMGHYQPHPKMFWKRNLELGYYYWCDRSELSIEDYIRYLDYIPLEKNSQFINERQLRKLLSAINNRHLPGNHTSSWEILVGRQPLLDAQRNVLRFPVVFRVHHSLGDGVALMRLLMEGIVDKEIPSLWQRLSHFKVLNLEHILKEQTLQLAPEPIAIRKFVQKLPSVQEIRIWSRRQLVKLWCIYNTPAFFEESAARKIDKNCIHAEVLTNEKVISWIHEEEFSNTKWVEIIKKTKHQIPGARFSDAFLTALSSSLRKYFEKKSNPLPNNITVVLPTRVEKESPQLKLHNRFSVALQTLPIAPGVELNNPNRYFNLLDRLDRVKSHTDILRSSPDYLINYWIMSSVTCFLPEPVLRKILKSAHCTLAISNLPGPQEKPRIQGRELKNLSFWIPNIGQTAVGLTLLTYGGKLQLGIAADRAVIATEDDAHSILAETVREIEHMGCVLQDV